MNEILVKAKDGGKTLGGELLQDWPATLSLLYIFVPVVLFFFGWLRAPLAVLLTLLMLWLFYRIRRNLAPKSSIVSFKVRPEYWIALSVVVFMWVFFSGIGGFSYQNADYYVRNPIYRDLVNQPWPVFFDFSLQKASVQAVMGNGSAAFIYYFCFWLPPAMLSKLFAGNEFLSNVFLLVWAYLGVMLVLHQIHRYLKRCSWVIPGIFIFFGGLDALGYRLLKGDFELGDHLEWWRTLFQYSSHTTVLYWVFNQAIPVWLIAALLLNMRGNVSTVGLSALIFAYSPFATFGMVPLAVYSVFKGRQDWKKAVSWENVLLPLVMLLIFGSFYLSNPNNISTQGWIFQFYPRKSLLSSYLQFLVLEIGVYAVFLRKCLRQYEYLWLVLAELALIPMYRMTAMNDFAMRASLPALFVLSVCLMRYVLASGGKWKKWAILCMFMVGAITPLSEMYRSVSNTVLLRAEPVETVYSFQAFATDNEQILRTCRQQFFAYEPEKQFFFRYLGRKTE